MANIKRYGPQAQVTDNPYFRFLFLKTKIRVAEKKSWLKITP